MVVRQFDVFGVATFPDEADPPLIVDTNTMLTGPVPSQGFKTISRRDTQVKNRLGSMQHHQFPKGNSLHVRRDSFGVGAVPY